MVTLFIISLIICIIGLGIFLWSKSQQRSFGALSSEVVYQDSDEKDAEVLKATSLPLYGKPDYIIEQDNTKIPVEVKTGKTPKHGPYNNHVMQLMAYCYLLEETYGEKPPGGVLKYPEKEYKIAYTDEARQSIKVVVNEILKATRDNKEFTCKHPNHNQ